MKTILTTIILSIITLSTHATEIAIPEQKLFWDSGYSAKSMSWDDAVVYCSDKGEGWRLPTVQEIVTILDYINLDPAFNGMFPNERSSYYWTGTESPIRKPGYAWALFSTYGNIFFRTKNNNHLVKCVKSL